LGDFTAKLEATREKLTKQLEEKRAQQHNREDEAKRNASKERKKLEQEMQAQIDAEEARFQQVLRLEQTQTAELIQKHRRQAEMEKERLARLQADMRQAEVERQAELKAAEAKAMVDRQRQQRQEEQRRQAAQQQHVHQMRAVPQATTLKKVACVKCTVVTPMVSCVRCPDGHDMCKTCFEELVRYVATRSTRPAQGSRLPCPQHGCPADYTQINVGIYATPATAEAYNQLVADLHAAVARQEQDLQHMRAAQELPGGWIMANGLPWTHYSPGETPGPLVVKASTEEFVMCSRRFREGSMSTRRLKRVQRVQNPRLWMKYRKTCEAIELQVAGGKNEQLLFHATRTVAPAEIAETTGIDFRHSIEGLFGRGAYFAERSEYSAQTQYIHTNVHGEKQMFLAQVAAGNVQPLERHQRDREMKHPAAGFDSVRGHVLDPDYYALIVYEVSQSYPAYILTYE
jgi:multidrug efflux pump subunit AcrA (membrane-fusion protein)